MALLDTFEKQPAEIQDYDVDFSPWLQRLGDAAVSHNVSAPAGITVASSTLQDGRVKVWLREGIHGSNYKVTIRIGTAAGRVKEAEIAIRVRET